MTFPPKGKVTAAFQKSASRHQTMVVSEGIRRHVPKPVMKPPQPTRSIVDRSVEEKRQIERSRGLWAKKLANTRNTSVKLKDTFNKSAKDRER